MIRLDERDKSIIAQLCILRRRVCPGPCHDEHRRRRRHAGPRPGRDGRPEARRHRAAQPAGQPRCSGVRLPHRTAARCRDRRERVPRPAHADRDPERVDGPAVGRGRPRRLSAAVPCRPARVLGHPVHADGDGDRADDPHHPDHRGALAPGRRRRLAGVSRAAALPRRDAAGRCCRRCCGTCASRSRPSCWPASGARRPKWAR